MIKYISTRNPDHKVSSSKAILSGQAPDGGLYIPEHLEDIKCDYHDILSGDFRSMAKAVWNLFFPDYGQDKINSLVEKSYEGKFSAPEITPLVSVGSSNVLELYHGPTSAFKDVALSALPNLLTAAREMNDFTDEIMILTATQAVPLFADSAEYPEQGSSYSILSAEYPTPSVFRWSPLLARMHQHARSAVILMMHRQASRSSSARSLSR